MFCSRCGTQLANDCIFCSSCGLQLAPTQKQREENARRQAQYQHDMQVKALKEHMKQMKRQGILFCPRCGNVNVQYMNSKTYGQRDAKVKTKYTANLNPLHPFTLVNKKEKVVRKASDGYTVDKFHCGRCGNVFTK